MSRSNIDTSNIDIANKILQRVKRVKFPKDTFWVKVYSNCREQGFCIRGWNGVSDFYASFSENRNSDEIVVYAESIGDPDKREYEKRWDDQNRPSEDAYKAAKYFKPGDFDGAAKYIVAQMRAYEKRVKQENAEREK